MADKWFSVHAVEINLFCTIVYKKNVINLVTCCFDTRKHLLNSRKQIINNTTFGQGKYNKCSMFRVFLGSARSTHYLFYLLASCFRCSVRLSLLLFVGVCMSYLLYLCLFAYSGVQHILCCVLILFFFVLCALCRRFLWIVLFWLPFRYYLTFMRYKYLKYFCFNWRVNLNGLYSPCWHWPGILAKH